MVINVAIVFIFTDSEDLHQIFTFSVSMLLLAAGLRLVPWVTKTLRLMNWMHFLEHPFSFREGLQISMMSELGAALSPTSIGGEPVKTGMLYQKKASFGEAASLTTIAAVEDLSFYIIGIPLAIFITSSWPIPMLQTVFKAAISSAPVMLLVIGSIAACFLLAFIIIRKTKLFKGIRRKINAFWKDFRALYVSMIKRGKGRFIINVFLSALHWGSRYSVVAVLALGLDYEVDVIKFFLLQWIVFTLMSFVPTPGATGGAEGLFLLIFGGILPSQAIGTLLIGWRFLDFYFLTILALLILGGDLLFQWIASKAQKSAANTTLKKGMQGGQAVNDGTLAVDKPETIGHEDDGVE